MLVVLFVLTILLLYLSWNQNGSSFSIADIIPIEVRHAAAVSEGEIIRPSRIIVSNSANNYFSEYSDDGAAVFESAKEEAAKLLAPAGTVVTEITLEQYEAACSEFDSVQLYFDCNIPFRAFCERLCDRAPSSVDLAGSFYILAFSDADLKSFFIKSGDGAFRVISDVERSPLSVIESKFTGPETVMFHASEILGGQSSCFIPIMVSMNAERGSAAAHVGNYEDIAESVFGDTFDFVRKITDTFGNVTYMYSYGAKRLTITADGTLEFKEDVSGGSSEGFYSDLDKALAFLSSTDSFAAGSLRLSSAQELQGMQQNRVRGYRFSFVQSAGDLAVHTENPAATIEVYGGKISYAKICLLNLNTQAGESYIAYDAANLIAENSSYLYESLTGESAESADAAFRFIADRLSDLYPGYVVRGDELLPVWLLELGGSTFAFDIITGAGYGLV